MMNINDFKKFKSEKRPISMVTCYDATTAANLAETEIDCLLVGDTVSMTVHGYSDTLQADIPMMAAHTGAVRRGYQEAFIISDMPFLSYRKGSFAALEAAGELMKAGASAIKLEGADSIVIEAVKAMVKAGIPVMGHLGLTPQSVNTLGGYRVQGKETTAAEKIIADAEQLQDAGCFSIVLECIPESLAAKISEKLVIPIIGIGAGNKVDGQVLVIQDLLGETKGMTPKFVRHFGDGQSFIKNAVNTYVESVKAGSFPSDKESYH